MVRPSWGNGGTVRGSAGPAFCPDDSAGAAGCGAAPASPGAAAEFSAARGAAPSPGAIPASERSSSAAAAAGPAACRAVFGATPPWCICSATGSGPPVVSDGITAARAPPCRARAGLPVVGMADGMAASARRAVLGGGGGGAGRRVFSRCPGSVAARASRTGAARSRNNANPEQRIVPAPSEASPGMGRAVRAWNRAGIADGDRLRVSLARPGRWRRCGPWRSRYRAVGSVWRAHRAWPPPPSFCCQRGQCRLGLASAARSGGQQPGRIPVLHHRFAEARGSAEPGGHVPGQS